LNKPKYEQLGQFEELIFNCFKKGVFGGPVYKKTKKEDDSIQSVSTNIMVSRIND